jgi:trehalose 6-phosphate synthase
MSEGRLVVVSNRVPAAPQAGRPSAAGGLASALEQALAEAGGLWFGWSGAAGDPQAPPAHRRAGNVEYATLDLSAEEVAEYYEGFCNRALWPLLHGFSERAHLNAAQYAVYRDVNARFAEQLAPLLRAGDRVWVHDYHLLPLGAELRRREWSGRLGFFLHIPLPPAAEWMRFPGAAELARSLAAYDLVGVQTGRDVRAGRAILEASGAAEAALRVAAFPIGIDPEHWRALAAAEPASPFEPTARGRRVLFGADRLDYSKGIPLRFEAFRRLLEREPRWRSEALLVQWSAPSRGAIPEYRAEQERVEGLARDLDARFGPGSADAEGAAASPVWHEVVTHEASTIAAGYREAAVSLVTSLSDGMNLVAKEFVAVQREEDPGVLLLSRGCGAAEELVEALLVEPGDVEALAGAMARALAMPLAERQERWRALLARVEGATVHDWRRGFLAALDAAPARSTA